MQQHSSVQHSGALESHLSVGSSASFIVGDIERGESVSPRTAARQRSSREVSMAAGTGQQGRVVQDAFADPSHQTRCQTPVYQHSSTASCAQAGVAGAAAYQTADRRQRGSLSAPCYCALGPVSSTVPRTDADTREQGYRDTRAKPSVIADVNRICACLCLSPFLTQACYTIINAWISRKFLLGVCILFPVAVTAYITWWFLVGN